MGLQMWHDYCVNCNDNIPLKGGLHMSDHELLEVLILFDSASDDIKTRALQILRESILPVESPDQLFYKDQ